MDATEKTDILYRCRKCDRTQARQAGADAPECCDEAMTPEPLPPCTTAAHAEMARNTDDDEPCDDGRGGQL